MCTCATSRARRAVPLLVRPQHTQAMPQISRWQRTLHSFRISLMRHISMFMNPFASSSLKVTSAPGTARLSAGSASCPCTEGRSNLSASAAWSGNATAPTPSTRRSGTKKSIAVPWPHAGCSNAPRFSARTRYGKSLRGLPLAVPATWFRHKRSTTATTRHPQMSWVVPGLAGPVCVVLHAAACGQGHEPLQATVVAARQSLCQDCRRCTGRPQPCLPYMTGPGGAGGSRGRACGLVSCRACRARVRAIRRTRSPGSTPGAWTGASGQLALDLLQ